MPRCFSCLVAGLDLEKRVKTAPIVLRIRPELKAAAEAAAKAAAKADHRSLTSLVEKLLTDYCRKKSFLQDED